MKDEPQATPHSRGVDEALRVPTPFGGDAPLTKVPQPGTPITPASVEKLRQAFRDGKIPKSPKR